MNIGALRTLIPPPERRSDPEIEADLDDEIAFHLAQIERELVEEGATAEEARAGAIARFGNVEKIKKRCKRIALEERIMLQRINAVLMVIVLIAVAFVSVQVYLTQRHNSVALLDISTQITKMRLDAAAPADQPRVLVEGDVERPGWYTIEMNNGATYLHELLERAGGVKHEDAAVQHLRRDAGGDLHPASPSQIAYTARDFLSTEPRKVVLHPNDHVYVYPMRNESPPPVQATGDWTLSQGIDSPRPDDANTTRILVAGDIERPGWQRITLDEVTYIHQMLERVGAKPEQWVRHRQERATTQPTTVPARVYAESRRDAILRPGDELHITDAVQDHVRRRFAIDTLAAFEGEVFIQVDELGTPIESGWMLTARLRRTSTTRYIHTVLEHPELDEPLSIDLHPSGARSGHPRHPATDWGYDEGVLWIDPLEVDLTGAPDLVARDFAGTLRFEMRSAVDADTAGR